MQVDRVLHDVALRLEIGEDVDRRIRDEQSLGIGRHVEHEDMANPPSRAEPTLLGDDLVHQHIGVEAALHQAVRLAVADKAHRGGSGLLLGCDIHDLEAADVEASFWAAARIRVADPIRIGAMMFSLAASMGPASACSSHGQTTAVGTAVILFACAISRSYPSRASVPLWARRYRPRRSYTASLTARLELKA